VLADYSSARLLDVDFGFLRRNSGTGIAELSMDAFNRHCLQGEGTEASLTDVDTSDHHQ
jgi:hypothetical protein